MRWWLGMETTANGWDPLPGAIRDVKEVAEYFGPVRLIFSLF